MMIMSDFSSLEEQINEYWLKNGIYCQTLKKSKKYPKFVFYDGPPFATGLPHYGHILASTIKDIISRYKSQTGHYVPRKWGWDTHGLPIEFEIEKRLGIKTRAEAEKFGIERYINECRKIVLEYSSEWKSTISRLGRWIDMDNSYRTMDPEYMESVWWLFKRLFLQGKVYHGHKVMPYSTRCGTPLSNFEASMNYKNVSDPSLIVKFKLPGLDATALVWTTTPWTLPSNAALCVNPSLVYYIFKQGQDKYLASKEYYQKLSETELISELKGSEIAGMEYLSLFESDRSNMTVLADEFVTSDSGTGVVHLAPAFGVDDRRVCITSGLITKHEIDCPIDSNGCFIGDKLLGSLLSSKLDGLEFKKADNVICSILKESGKLYKKSSIVHSYPHCWRTDSPLMYRAVPSWFVDVTSMRYKMLECLSETNWRPETVKNRFVQWVKSSVDWCISRDRWWGTPIPIWTNGDETVCIGSISELEELACLEKGTVSDLHRDKIDHIEIKSARVGGKPLRRIPDVFDCWFESGCMPYASVHYPFDVTTSELESIFPADFIAEGLDQTRGWFYTLTVLSTALFRKSAFKNVIVNGILLSKKGEKLSKRLKNYEPPEKVFNKYGADALRLYLTKSPAVQGGEIKFDSKGVRQIVQTILIPLKNCVKLLIKNATSPELVTAPKSTKLENIMDHWILQKLEELVTDYHNAMTSYNLMPISKMIHQFISDLSKKYINTNKQRIISKNRDACGALFYCIRVLCLLLAPFAPFQAEHIYLKLRKISTFECTASSIHLITIPQHIWHTNTKFVKGVSNLFELIDAVSSIREATRYSFKRQFKRMTIYQLDTTCNELSGLTHYITNHLNIDRVNINTVLPNRLAKMVVSCLIPNFDKLAPLIGNKIPKLKALIAKPESIEKFLKSGMLEFEGHQLDSEHLILDRKLIPTRSSKVIYHLSNKYLLAIDTTLTEEISFLHEARILVSFINKTRAKLDLTNEETEMIGICYNISGSMKDCSAESLTKCNALLTSKQEEFVLSLLGRKIWPYSRTDDDNDMYFFRGNVTLFGVNTEILFRKVEAEVMINSEPNVILEAQANDNHV